MALKYRMIRCLHEIRANFNRAMLLALGAMAFAAEVAAAESAAFVLITHRPDYAAPWKGHRHLTSLALNRLSREQAGKIVEAVGEGRLSGPVVDKIVARADGVPLFVEELTKSVLEAGEISGGPIAVDAVPATLQASLKIGRAHV